MELFCRKLFSILIFIIKFTNNLKILTKKLGDYMYNLGVGKVFLTNAEKTHIG